MESSILANGFPQNRRNTVQRAQVRIDIARRLGLMYPEQASWSDIWQGIDALANKAIAKAFRDEISNTLDGARPTH